MKYSEFERDIGSMGYSLVHGIDDLYVKKGNLDLVISVGFRDTYTINSDYEHFRSLEDSEKERLLDLAWQLASTPLEERMDEKKYRLRLPFVTDNTKYLAVHKITRDPIISYPVSYYEEYQYEFTESEIIKLKQAYNLDSFVVEEVFDDVN